MHRISWRGGFHAKRLHKTRNLRGFRTSGEGSGTFWRCAAFNPVIVLFIQGKRKPAPLQEHVSNIAVRIYEKFLYLMRQLLSFFPVDYARQHELNADQDRSLWIVRSLDFEAEDVELVEELNETWAICTRRAGKL